MLTYYDWDASPNCLKTRILLNELAIPYEEVTLDRTKLASLAFRSRFPAGQAPAIEDDGLRLAESGAIALYLAEKHGALVPKEPRRRALMFQALSFESALLAPTTGGQGLFGELAKPEAERNLPRVAELGQKAQRVAQILGAILDDKTFFAEEFSVADIQIYAATAKSIEARVFEDPPKNLVDWHARMTERPSVVKARPKYVHYRKA